MCIDPGELCDRMAVRLYNQPVCRSGLIDIGTVLMFVCHALRADAGHLDSLNGPSVRTGAVRLAANACERRLLWLGRQSDALPQAKLACTVDRILHILVLAVGVLERASTSHQRQDA